MRSRLLLLLPLSGCLLLTGVLRPDCGDGAKQKDELCDDGNTENGDGCNATCDSIEECGDEFANFDEECDDGNLLDGDGCSEECLIEDPLCGNGAIDAGEECDDGNTVDEDGCESDCSLICKSPIPPPLGEELPGRAAIDKDVQNCFLGFTEDLIWDDARIKCEDIGGHLAVIEETKELNVAKKAIIPDTGPWIGFNDIDVEANQDPNKFVSVLGDQLKLDQAFEPGEPSATNDDEDCVHFLRPALPTDPVGGWNDLGCQGAVGFTRGYLCEIEAQ